MCVSDASNSPNLCLPILIISHFYLPCTAIPYLLRGTPTRTSCTYTSTRSWMRHCRCTYICMRAAFVLPCVCVGIRLYIIFSPTLRHKYMYVVRQSSSVVLLLLFATVFGCGALLYEVYAPDSDFPTPLSSSYKAECTLLFTHYEYFLPQFLCVALATFALLYALRGRNDAFNLNGELRVTAAAWTCFICICFPVIILIRNSINADNDAHALQQQSHLHTPYDAASTSWTSYIRLNYLILLVQLGIFTQSIVMPLYTSISSEKQARRVAAYDVNPHLLRRHSLSHKHGVGTDTAGHHTVITGSRQPLHTHIPNHANIIQHHNSNASSSMPMLRGRDALVVDSLRSILLHPQGLILFEQHATKHLCVENVMFW